MKVLVKKPCESILVNANFIKIKPVISKVYSNHCVGIKLCAEIDTENSIYVVNTIYELLIKIEQEEYDSDLIISIAEKGLSRIQNSIDERLVELINTHSCICMNGLLSSFDNEEFFIQVNPHAVIRATKTSEIVQIDKKEE